MRMAKKQGLVTNNLTHIHRSVFDRFPKALLDVIGQQSGLYALYRQTSAGDLSLYYVGKSKNLKFRLQQHLKNEHANKWIRFSFFAIKNKMHIDSIEALVLNMYQPKANKQMPRFGKGLQIQQLKNNIKQIQKQNLDKMFYTSSHKGEKKAKKTKIRMRMHKTLSDIGPKILHARVGGKTVSAKLLSSGKIKFKNKVYDSPSGAANMAAQYNVNGWNFWKFKAGQGEWVPLKSLRK